MGTTSTISLAFDQVQGVEALAELAGLGVAHVDAVADLQVAGGGAAERGLHLAGALLGVELEPGRQPGRGDARGVAAARGEVAAAERRGDAGVGLRTIGRAKPAAGVRLKRL